MSEDFFRSLPIQTKLTPAGSTQVVAGNGKSLNIVGWTILKFDIANRPFSHTVGVVKDLPVQFLIGGETLRPHAATLQYFPPGRNTLSFSEGPCTACNDNLPDLNALCSTQLIRQFKHQPPLS